jgi:hypothetical protein
MNVARFLKANFYLFLLTSFLLSNTLTAEHLNDPRVDKIAQIVSLFLDGKIKEGESIAKQQELFTNGNDIEKDDFFIMLTQYLARDKNIKASDIVEWASEKPGYYCVASLAMFTRKVANKQRLDSFSLINDINMYIMNLDSVDSPAIQEWKEQAPLWIKWCESDFKEKEGLAPLFQDITKKKIPFIGDDVLKINLDDFKALRKKYYPKRYKPRGVIFNKERMEKYRDSLPTFDMQISEIRRYRFIKDVQTYLVHMFAKNSYTGFIKLRRGGIHGTVAMANESLLIVRRKGRKTKRYKWTDLHSRQFATFLMYFGKLRKNLGSPSVDKKQRLKESAEDFLRAAVILDWYGDYKRALKCVKIAIKISPAVHSKANKLFLQ